MAEKKEKRYVSDNAQLMAEWDWEKNDELGFDPTKLTYGSNRKVNWKCKLGHEWKAPISDRTRGRNCPYCSGRRIIEGTNDLSTTNPELIPEWHPTRNEGLTPQKVSAGSNRKVWWLCEEGHEWQAYIYTRAKGVGCPQCAQVSRVKNNTRNQIDAKGSLATKFPELTKEWDYIKNGTLTPADVLCGSTKKVWWKCSKGHSWEARISHRTAGVGCPICAQATQSSFPEQAILFYLKQFADAKHRYVHNGFEMDIYLPAYHIGIEYDGVYYHKGEKSFLREQQKDKALLADGITVIRVKETWKLEDAINENVIYCVPTTGNTHMNKVIPLLAKRLSRMTGLDFCNLDVNVQRDQIEIRNQLLQYEREHSAYSVNPALQKELHPTKNGQITLDYVSAQSSQRLWWQCCVCGTEWQTSVANRVKGSGCPTCSLGIRTQKRNATLLATAGSLLEQNAKLAEEWHPTKNGVLTPEMVTPASGKKVWWLCKEGHEWEALVSNRAKGSGCPYCAGQRAIVGHNDLTTTHPKLIAEWNFEKNTTIKPEDVMGGTNKKVWWKCENGHEWQAKISDRTRGYGCPECAKVVRRSTYTKTILNQNGSLSKRYPNISTQWNAEKNGSLTPDMVTPSSSKKVWWKCENGHEWEALISSRTQGGSCPYCSGRRVMAGFNDLATKDPELAKQWHPLLNGELKPSDVTISSGKSVWWKCKKGHEFQALISNRSKGSGCPYCAGHKPIVGETDLVTKNPELALEWHPTKNGSLLPTSITVSSGKKVWWLCKEGHEWEAAVYSRSSGNGCPECAKQKRKKAKTE